MSGSYKEVEGNLLDMFDKGEFDVIAHGANCQSKMGAGIAKQIKERYPDAYYADLYDWRLPEMKLGSLSWTNDRSIFNLYTQYDLGKDARISALCNALAQFNLIVSKDLKIGLPQIGCGIGGLEWSVVKAIIQKYLKDYDVTVVIYKP